MLPSLHTTARLAEEVAAGAQLLVHNGDISCEQLGGRGCAGAHACKLLAAGAQLLMHCGGVCSEVTSGGCAIVYIMPVLCGFEHRRLQATQACTRVLQPGLVGNAHLPGTPARPPLLHHVLLLLTEWPPQCPSRADARGFSSQWDVYFDQLGGTVRRVPYMTTGTAVIKIELLLPPALFLTGLPTVLSCDRAGVPPSLVPTGLFLPCGPAVGNHERDWPGSGDRFPAQYDSGGEVRAVPAVRAALLMHVYSA